MDLNNLQLSTFTITNLYKDKLVKKGEDILNVPKNNSISNKFLGGNLQNILLVISNNKAPFFEDHQLTFLTKVLSACKLSLADVAIMNIYGLPDNDLLELLELLKPVKVAMFGVSSLELKLPFQIPEFQLQAYNHTQYLIIPELDLIEKDQQLKKYLWASFQKLFLN